MELLDLPPEVFQRIIKEYVTVESPRKAARARLVSRTFHGYIQEELFARQAVSKFKGRVGKKLLEKNLATFLSYRTKSLHGAPDFLPLVIRGTVDKFVELGMPERWRSHMTEKVIQAIIAHSNHFPVNLAIAPTSHQRNILNDDRMKNIPLVVALCLGSEAVVNKVLETGIDPWGRTGLFKHAICVATKSNSMKPLEILLSRKVAIDTGVDQNRRKHLQSRVMTDAIDIAVNKGYWMIAEYLITWTTERIAKPLPGMLAIWVRQAVSSDALGLLKKMRKLGLFPRNIGRFAEHIAQGLVQNIKPEPVLRFCIMEGLLDVNTKLYTRCDEPVYLLDDAIHYKNLSLVKAALSVNGYANRSKALRSAIRTGSAPIVRALLASGVDPEAQMHPPAKRTTCELAKNSPEIFKMLETAIERKMDILGPRYQAPHQVIGTDAYGRDIYQAYTYHRPEPEHQV